MAATDPQATRCHHVSPLLVVVAAAAAAAFTAFGLFPLFLRYEVIGTGYLARGVAFVLLLILGLSALLAAFRLPLISRRAALFITAVLLTIAALPGQEFSQHVYLNLLGIVYYTTPDIAPEDLYLHEIPPALVPSTDREDPVVRWAYEGMPPGMRAPYSQWVGPLALWSIFWLSLYFTVACLTLLIFPRWEEEEKLIFPLMQVPLELTEALPRSLPPIFRNKLFWFGFAAPVLLYLVKGLHAYVPAIPDINLQRTTERMFASGPLMAWNNMPLHIYPEMIGIAYLLSAEVGFSIWFFRQLHYFVQFVRLAVGHRTSEPLYRPATVGGYVVLAAAMFWSSREYLAKAVDAAVYGRGASYPYRLALLGLIGGLATMLAWCSHFGLSLSWAALQWIAYLVVALVVARVVCEAGIFIYSAPFRLNQVIVEMFTPRAIGTRNILMLFMTSWAEIRGTATQAPGYWFQALKLVRAVGISPASFLGAAMLAVAVTIFVSHVVSLHIIYSWGVPKLGWWPRGSGLNTTRLLVRYLQNPHTYGPTQWIAVASGGLFTAFLVYMRQRFTWWPFHPLGFITWTGWPTQRYWLSVMLGWLWKVVTVRFFGFKAFATGRPVAIGMIAGLCFIITVWLIIHLIWPAPPLIIE